MTLTKDERTMALHEIVPEYHSSIPPVKWLFHERIRKSIAVAHLQGNEKVLDLGCGEGLLLKRLKAQHPALTCTGIDFNVQVKNLKVPGCTVEVGDATKLRFKDNSFDVVFALDVLEHIEELDKAIREMHRVLKPGGRAIIVGPTETWIYKSLRFVIKGTFSEKEGPGTGVHHHTIYSIKKAFRRHPGLAMERDLRLPAELPFSVERLLVLRKA